MVFLKLSLTFKKGSCITKNEENSYFLNLDNNRINKNQKGKNNKIEANMIEKNSFYLLLSNFNLKI